MIRLSPPSLSLPISRTFPTLNWSPPRIVRPKPWLVRRRRTSQGFGRTMRGGDQFNVGNVLEIGSDKLGGERRIIHDKSSDRHSRRRSEFRENACPSVRTTYNRKKLHSGGNGSSIKGNF